MTPKLTEPDKHLLIALLVERAEWHRKTAAYMRTRKPTDTWEGVSRDDAANDHDQKAVEADTLRAKLEDSTKPRKA